MIKTLSLLSFIIIIGCKANDVNPSIQEGSELIPPGCTKISENFYADISELPNIGYKEYQYWTIKIFGKKSKEYEETLLDTTVWLQEPKVNLYKEIYHSHPNYDNYPVVGVSLDQAKKYTKWRTDRVAEKILVELGLVKLNLDQTSDNYFTIEKYFDKSYDGIIKVQEIALPEYKIPNLEEWNIISGIQSNNIDELYELSKHNKKTFKHFGYLFNTIEYNESDANKVKGETESDSTKYIMITSPTRIFETNKYNLFGIVGNVSELIEESGKSMGGNWRTSIKEIKINETNQFDKPNSWTGFRNVCYIKKRKIENGS